ncbi:MAG: hypothetical protein COZ98_05570 [Candidatus Omnitrophica bacterium CG_4_8_14_3_um_filter_43_15]|nr:MAG: hypothetical protein COZ98_05570 [Candidatus Omnitrophica bacterium CG_4_8_14_3_um_filter_43_15]
MVNEMMNEGKFKKGLQEIIDSLGWVILRECFNTKSGYKIKIPVLENSYQYPKPEKYEFRLLYVRLL